MNNETEINTTNKNKSTVEHLVIRILARYNADKINLGTLCWGLRKMERDFNYKIEELLKEHGDALTLFLIATYERSGAI